MDNIEYFNDFRDFRYFGTENMQEYIMHRTKSTKDFKPHQELRTRINFLKRFLRDSKQKSYVLGISGGQDSTLVGKLAQIAVNELNKEIGHSEFKFVALLLPYGKQKDINDAKQAAYSFIDADVVIEHNIYDEVEAFTRTFEKSNGEPISDFNKGNLKARTRMQVQYAYAGAHNGFVLGTDHSAENALGFFTRWGDGACDLAPIFGLNKRQGRKLLELMGCPSNLYLKKPTAGLLDNEPELTDEESTGISYDDLDDFLEGKKIEELVAQKIIDRFIRTDFKREPIPDIYS